MAQLVEEGICVGAECPQVGEIVVAVAKLGRQANREFEPRDQEIAVAKRMGAGVEVERGDGIATASPADVGGIDVVEVGQETRGGRKT
jgi:hypothetical protein